MSVVVVGIEHRQAPLELLEQVAVADNEVPKVLGALRERANLQEALVLSTCLRTEVYAVVDRFHDAVHEIAEVLGELAGLPPRGPGGLEERLAIRFDDDVVTHLFAVAAGLESAVPGESEVLGQVRRAWERARDERVSGPVLAELFRHAVQVGKRVRTETGIARGTTSFSHAAAAQLHARRDGGLQGATVVVVGAGEVGAGVARALLPGSGRGPAEVVLANRTVQRAEAAAPDAPGARPIGFKDLPAAVARADVVVTALEGAPHLFGTELFAPSGHRADHPVLVVDLGMPRNVDPATGTVPGVTLLDMDDVSAAVAAALEERHEEADLARAIVDEEVARHRDAARARGAAPVVAALRSHMEEARLAELGRRRGEFGDLSDEDWAQVDAVTRAVLAKLLHEPTAALKATAGTPRGERLVEALRVLFDL